MREWVNRDQESELVSGLNYQILTDSYQSALRVVEDVILKNYISELSHLEIIPLNKRILQSNIRDNVLFFKITEMVYEKEEFATYKFASVFNALSLTESAVFIIIDSDGVKTDFYMGVRSLDEYRTTSSVKDTVENAMRGQFPGIKTTEYTIEEMEEILSNIKANSISAVSGVANSKTQENSNQNFVQGLEKLVLSMQGEKYTGIIIANGTTQEQLRELRKEYENVYTQLSPFATTQVNYSINNVFNHSVSRTQSSSQAKSYTENYSEGHSQSKSNSISDSKSVSKESVAGRTVKGVASAASLIGAALAPFTGGKSLAIGGVISGGLGILGTAVTETVSDSASVNQTLSDAYSINKGFSRGMTNSVSNGVSKAEGYSQGKSEGMMLSLHDKSVENILERINKQLKRMDEFESVGMYECAAYFLSDDQYASEIAASTYKALMRGENSGVEIAAVNSWGQYQKEKTKMIGQYVKNFMHPVFAYHGFDGKIEVTPCSLVSGNELAIHMGLPRRSVCGLPVIEHADFGKEVVINNSTKRSVEINLGHIYNMGSICSNHVTLNLNSLSMHSFVTGSTGSGKSNTIYRMLRQLDNFGINFLIIEPAKGEYKNVFGHLPGVCVFGTNPQFMDLLRINPFRFPKGIHILEHIDRLIEIFNVCWPMYAAMPSVLKEAILQAYQACGWDLSESRNAYSEELFPTFLDLLRELENVIKSSAYSEEVKSNYTGSLVTRIKSLTNGLNGKIFTANEIADTKLFDEKVIVDISRVGSTETQSLIMGILIMRLSEYRIVNSDEMNAQLHHVTVLEEAHHILKRSSIKSNMEGTDVAGKSVEMIANAIAEMRTYGEGFVIADQSPSAIDISAIRNTNTKIIMRLPDEYDRRLVGKSAGLKDNQLDEIAKLPMGVAVVYQNDWIEPVLCKIDKFVGLEKKYRNASVLHSAEINIKATTILVNFIIKNRLENAISYSYRQIEWAIEKCECSAKTKMYLYLLLDEFKLNNRLTLWERKNFLQQSIIVQEVLNLDSAVECSRRSSIDFIGFNCNLNALVARKIENLTNEVCLNVNHCLMKVYSEQELDNMEYYQNWRNEIMQRGRLL